MYLVGLLIGVGLVAMMYGNRACSFLPGKQVLQSIRSSDIMITASAQCYLLKGDVTREQIFELVTEGSGEVLFSESEPREKPKMYMVEGTLAGSLIKVAFTQLDSVAGIRTIYINGKEISGCEVTSDTLVDIWRHNDRIIYDLNSRNIIMNVEIQNELKQMGVDQMEVYKIFENGIVIYEESYPMRKPEPRYMIEGDINGMPFKMLFQVGENSRLVSIER